MILLFLRDWRSALVVVVNIPLAILAAMIALWASGQTVNLMTLGGLALAVGILVDEATVVIENVHSHLGRGAALANASYDGTLETRGYRVSSRCSASSQSSSPPSSCRVRRTISSSRSRWRWASQWSPPMCCPPRSSRSC